MLDKYSDYSQKTWGEKWQMKFNSADCHGALTQRTGIQLASTTLHSQVLERMSSQNTWALSRQSISTGENIYPRSRGKSQQGQRLYVHRQEPEITSSYGPLTLKESGPPSVAVCSCGLEPTPEEPQV